MPAAMSGQFFSRFLAFSGVLCIESLPEQHDSELVSPIPATSHGARQAPEAAMYNFDETD